MLTFLGLTFILFAGLRWKTGTDWDNYYNNFYDTPNFEVGGSGFEFLYELTVRFVFWLFGNYQCMLFITALMIIVPTYKIIYKFSPYPIISLFILFTYSLNSNGFGYRQDIAIAITFFSFLFIYKQKIYPFFICVLIATLFHQSAIFFLSAYWIFKFKWNKKSIAIVFVISVLLFLAFSKMKDLAALYSASASDKIEAYSNSDFQDSTFDGGDPYVVIFRGLINRLFILIVPILVLKSNSNSNNDTSLIFGILNFVLFGVLLYVIVSPFGVVLLRFTRYFDIFQILLIPMSLFYVRPKYRLVLFFFYIIYGSFKFSLFLYNDLGILVPYRTYLF